MNIKVAVLLCIGNSFHKTNHIHLQRKQNICFVHFVRNLIIRLANAKKRKYMQEEDEKSRASVNTNSYAAPIESNVVNTTTDNNIHSLLKPYCNPANTVRSDGSVRQIQTLRDTGAMQSLLKNTHNSNDFITTNKTTLLKGITTQTQRVPLVQVHLRTNFINETVLCDLVNELPNGIDFLIGNDIWLKAYPLPDKVTEQACLLYTSPSPRD